VRRFLMVCVLLWFASINSISQEVKPKGVFLVDSAKIGEQIPYSLSIRYPKQMEFLFPDSNYNFFPFEFNSKNFFITRTDSLVSVDSAIFYLSTFEVEPVQKLFLPVFMIVLVSCQEKMEKPKNLLTKLQMIDLLVDIHLTEAKVKELYLKRDSSNQLFKILEKEVYERHQTTDSAYKKSILYYLDEMGKMEEIYSAVVDSLSLREKIKDFD